MADIKINGKTYSNVTGVRIPLADDTGYAAFTESEGGEGSPALFPLPWSKFTGGTTVKEVTNGNHVKIRSTTSASPFAINIPNAVDLIITNRSLSAGSMYYPIIPAGTEVTFAIKNVETNLDGYAVGMTAPNGTVDMNNSPLGKDGAGITGTNDRKSYTFTTTQETQISSFYFVFSGTGNAEAEFDLELTVGGVRWI